MLKYIKSWLSIYTTSGQVQIKSKALAVTYVLIVILVGVSYIASLEGNIRNVYQKSCPAKGAIVSKIKGHVSTEHIPDSDFQISDPGLYKRVWDYSDLVFPPYGGDGQDGSFIVVTDLLITPNQTRGICPESKKSGEICSSDAQCTRGKTHGKSNGVMTGKCDNGTGTCEVSAWCPVEQGDKPLKDKRVLLEGVKDFTILIKCSVEFPGCGTGQQYRRNNIPDNMTIPHIHSCTYGNDGDIGCPIFRLGDIIKWSGSDFSKVARNGGFFRIDVVWDCDFDWGPAKNECFPTYGFNRIDKEQPKISPGFNFRTSFYHEENRRTFTKMYGLKILVVVSGNGKQFDFLQLVLAIGATIGLFSVAPLFCDTLFDFFCYLKRFKPCQKSFGDFSVESRYQEYDEEGSLPKKSATATIVELRASNNAIEDSIIIGSNNKLSLHDVTIEESIGSNSKLSITSADLSHVQQSHFNENLPRTGAAGSKKKHKMPKLL